MAGKNKQMNFGAFMNNVKDNHEDLDRFKKEQEEKETKPTGEVITEEKHAPGRKPTVMGKKNGKTVYFDDDTQNKFRSIKYLQNIDATNVIYTAVVEFMDKNCEDGRLKETALEKIKEICKL